MTISHLLEDFGSAVPQAPTTPEDQEGAVEDYRLASFEQGYTAGWDDSLKTQTEEKHRITDALAKNLEDLNFTYEEAYTQMVQSVVPVFDAMVDQVLPQVMRDAIGHKVAEHVRAMVSDQDQHPVRLCVSEGYGPLLRPAVTTATSMPVTVYEDSSLSEGQAFLRIGDKEVELDPLGMVEDIRSAVQAFSHEIKTETAHG